jgi:hypothetical protein
MTRKRNARRFFGSERMPNSDKQSQPISMRLISQRPERYSGVTLSPLGRFFTDRSLCADTAMIRQHELHRAYQSTRMRMPNAVSVQFSEQCSMTRQENVNDLRSLLDLRGGIDAADRYGIRHRTHGPDEVDIDVEFRRPESAGESSVAQRATRTE